MAAKCLNRAGQRRWVKKRIVCSTTGYQRVRKRQSKVGTTTVLQVIKKTTESRGQYTFAVNNREHIHTFVIENARRDDGH